MIDIESIQARIKEIRARADRATHGPWETEFGNIYIPYDTRKVAALLMSSKDTIQARLNCKFVVHVRNAIPALCDDVEGLLEEIKALRMAYTGEITPIERFNDDAPLGDNS